MWRVCGLPVMGVRMEGYYRESSNPPDTPELAKVK